MAKIVENIGYTVTPFLREDTSGDKSDLDILIYPNEPAEDLICLRIEAEHTYDVNRYDAVQISAGKYNRTFISLYAFDDEIHYNTLSVLGRHLADDKDMMQTVTEIYNNNASPEALESVKARIKERLDNPAVVTVAEMIKQSGMSKEEFFREHNITEEKLLEIYGKED